MLRPDVALAAAVLCPCRCRIHADDPVVSVDLPAPLDAEQVLGGTDYCAIQLRREARRVAAFQHRHRLRAPTFANCLSQELAVPSSRAVCGPNTWRIRDVVVHSGDPGRPIVQVDVAVARLICLPRPRAIFAHDRVITTPALRPWCFVEAGHPIIHCCRTDVGEAQAVQADHAPRDDHGKAGAVVCLCHHGGSVTGRSACTAWELA
mmetsp:Transcript_34996/g.81184  ORF Transcript_34996/g.81184 Transcript_34996/m.81184 type:complete len:206 (-) Transcript_34996:3-620(-)